MCERTVHLVGFQMCDIARWMGDRWRFFITGGSRPEQNILKHRNDAPGGIVSVSCVLITALWEFRVHESDLTGIDAHAVVINRTTDGHYGVFSRVVLDTTKSPPWLCRNDW